MVQLYTKGHANTHTSVPSGHTDVKELKHQRSPLYSPCTTALDFMVLTECDKHM